MIERFAVSRLWLMETELWPSLLWACRRAGVPVGIVNGRLEKKSQQAYRRLRFILRPILREMRPVFVQDTTYGARFQELGCPAQNIIVTGNLKSMVAIERPPAQSVQSKRQMMSIDTRETVITVGCLHAGEAVQIRLAQNLVEKAGQRWKWIVVPRHPDQCAEIRAVFGDGIVAVDHLACKQAWTVCCVEGYGMLETAYMIADAAVVGGTFVPVGGHNPWEAAQYGIPVFFGPHYHTQAGSCERLLAAGVGFCASDGQALAALMQQTIIDKPAAFAAACAVFAAQIRSQVNRIEELIP
jgi:3-deoxy-D-manno-octulosonic-acid transferase